MVCFRNNIIKVDVFYGEMKYSTTKQSPGYDSVQFLSKFIIIVVIVVVIVVATAAAAATTTTTILSKSSDNE